MTSKKTLRLRRRLYWTYNYKVKVVRNEIRQFNVVYDGKVIIRTIFREQSLENFLFQAKCTNWTRYYLFVLT